MTTTPTLYVEELVPIRGTKTFYTGGFTYYPARPATHDELIAAMPRCGTCEWARERTKALASPDRKFCTWLDCPTKTDFGCTEHKEKQ